MIFEFSRTYGGGANRDGQGITVRNGPPLLMLDLQVMDCGSVPVPRTKKDPVEGHRGGMSTRNSRFARSGRVADLNGRPASIAEQSLEDACYR